MNDEEALSATARLATKEIEPSSNGKGKDARIVIRLGHWFLRT